MDEGSTRNAGIIVLIAGALAGLGALLPWIQVTSGFGTVSRSGIDGGGDGIIGLGLGIAGVIAGLNLMGKPGGWSWPFLIGIGIAIVGALNLANVEERADSLSSEFATAGVITTLAPLKVSYPGETMGSWQAHRRPRTRC